MRGIAVPLFGGCIELNFALSEIHAKGSFIWRRKAYPATGITNRVEDRDGNLLGFALFGDYDHTTLVEVEARINAARKKLSFGDAYIFRSSRDSFHAIIPTIHPYEEAVYFAALTGSGHDLTLFAREQELTLRTSPKNGLPIKYLKFMRDDRRYHFPPVSFPHMEFLAAAYGINSPAGARLVGEGGELEVKHYHYYNR